MLARPNRTLFADIARDLEAQCGGASICDRRRALTTGWGGFAGPHDWTTRWPPAKQQQQQPARRRTHDRGVVQVGGTTTSSSSSSSSPEEPADAPAPPGGTQHPKPPKTPPDWAAMGAGFSDQGFVEYFFALRRRTALLVSKRSCPRRLHYMHFNVPPKPWNCLGGGDADGNPCGVGAVELAGGDDRSEHPKASSSNSSADASEPSSSASASRQRRKTPADAAARTSTTSSSSAEDVASSATRRRRLQASASDDELKSVPPKLAKRKKQRAWDSPLATRAWGGHHCAQDWWWQYARARAHLDRPPGSCVAHCSHQLDAAMRRRGDPDYADYRPGPRCGHLWPHLGQTTAPRDPGTPAARATARRGDRAAQQPT